MKELNLETTRVARAVSRLRDAKQTGVPCPPVRDLLGKADIETAYQVQKALLDFDLQAGHKRVGRKIGLTSDAVQRQLGVDQPDFGALLDNMAVAVGSTIPPRRLMQPKVEAEVAFWLRRDLDGDLHSIDSIRAAIGSAATAIEVVDSRIAGWDITIIDTIADGASSGLFAVSSDRVSLDQFEPAQAEMTMWVNDNIASSGVGANCLGNPLLAVLWLARTASKFGAPLRAGEVVLSGALGPMVPIAPGDHVRATIAGLGTVALAFEEES